jgi:hypothetical protein
LTKHIPPDNDLKEPRAELLSRRSQRPAAIPLVTAS